MRTDRAHRCSNLSALVACMMRSSTLLLSLAAVLLAALVADAGHSTSRHLRRGPSRLDARRVHVGLAGGHTTGNGKRDAVFPRSDDPVAKMVHLELRQVKPRNAVSYTAHLAHGRARHDKRALRKRQSPMTRPGRPAFNSTVASNSTGAQSYVRSC